MEDLTLDPRTTALVLIDLENGIVSRDLAPYTLKEVVENCVELANKLRSAGATIVFVHVDINAVPHPPADNPRAQPPQPVPATANELLPTLGIQPTDHIVLKHQFGAFWNTDLHDYLQSKGVETIVLGGIATNIGVESTARAAFDRRYSLVFAEDAMSSVTKAMHQFSIEEFFPTIGRVRSTKQVLKALA